MTIEQFWNLQTGDIIRHVNDSDSYLVTANYGNHITAVKIADATNPAEWVLVLKANYKAPERKES